MIVQACLNGARLRDHHPRLPVLAAEMARDAAAAVRAGAAEIHLHVRDDQGRESLAPAAVDATLLAVRAAVPGTLIGTTDERFSGPPEEAVATEREVEYLLDLVNLIVPDVNLRRQDLAWTGASVRPLPRAEGGPTASITRRHFLVENFGCPVPLFSLVGGKLTTCRSLAEEAAGQVLKRLGIPQTAHRARRPILPPRMNRWRPRLARADPPIDR